MTDVAALFSIRNLHAPNLIIMETQAFPDTRQSTSGAAGTQKTVYRYAAVNLRLDTRPSKLTHRQVGASLCPTGRVALSFSEMSMYKGSRHRRQRLFAVDNV